MFITRNYEKREKNCEICEIFVIILTLLIFDEFVNRVVYSKKINIFYSQFNTRNLFFFYSKKIFLV